MLYLFTIIIIIRKIPTLPDESLLGRIRNSSKHDLYTANSIYLVQVLETMISEILVTIFV
jgi:hypothetical protein